MLDDMLPQPYADEIKGISEVTGLEVGKRDNIGVKIFTPKYWNIYQRVL